MKTRTTIAFKCTESLSRSEHLAVFIRYRQIKVCSGPYLKDFWIEVDAQMTSVFQATTLREYSNVPLLIWDYIQGKDVRSNQRIIQRQKIRNDPITSQCLCLHIITATKRPNSCFIHVRKIES